MLKKMMVIIVASLSVAAFTGITFADDTSLWETTVTPDALIILDRSGSMSEVPAGANLLSTTTSCSGSGPFYSIIPSNLTPTNFYTTSTNCSGSGPFITGGCISSSNLYVSGSSCSIDGPYYTSSTAYCASAANVYGYIKDVGGSCTGDGPYASASAADCMAIPTDGNYYIPSGNNCSSYTGRYYTTSGTHSMTNYNHACALSTIPATMYSKNSCSGSTYYYSSASATGVSSPNACQPCVKCSALSPYYTTGDCASGSFYKTSGSAHTQACTTCSTCSVPSTGYANNDCTNGPFYKTSGTGHTTSCSKCIACTSLSSTLYTATDCTNGPFYTSSGAGHTTKCTKATVCANKGTSAYCGNTACDGAYDPNNSSSTSGFYTASSGNCPTGHTTTCTKIAIAKNCLYNFLNADTTNSSINDADTTTLKVRLGLMSYTNCASSSDLPYTNTSSCIQLHWGLTKADNTTTTPFANLYCNDTSCLPTVTACSTTNTPPYNAAPSNAACLATSVPKACIAQFDNSGLTPLADALVQGKSYMDCQKGVDPSAACRIKSVIIVTDGADTLYQCNGAAASDLQRRRAVVNSAKALSDAGYNVYVVGFGSDMPPELQKTLNWAAFYGGSRNTTTGTGQTKIGSYNPNPNTTCDPDSSGNDPGASTTKISGYAYLASNPADLASALQSVLISMQAATYSFSQASVAPSRLQEENYIYEASFDPKVSSGGNKEPFWAGHLKKYQLNDTGGLIFPSCWDAGEILSAQGSGSRTMWTYKQTSASSKTLTSFDTGNITDADLALSTATTCSSSTISTDKTCTSVVGFYRGDPLYNLESYGLSSPWMLGDPFHTNPMVVTTPNQYFYDPRESGATSYFAYRSSNMRCAVSGKQLMLLGANDGQLHAFRTEASSGICGSSSSGGNCTSGGDEVWSFIPPNLLQKLQPIAHSDHNNRSTLNSHDYFIDGPLQVADVWLPSSVSDGTSKYASEWHTVAILGEGQGSGAYLWSSSPTCYSPYSTTTTYFSSTYSATFQYYCGYYALDVTDSATAGTPKYLWHLNPTAAQAPYLAQAWSKMAIGRVNIGGKEQWVGFIGGGYSGTACMKSDGTTTAACTTGTNSAGKGFFVVELTTGNILWNFTYGSSTSQMTSPYMNFDLTAAPIAMDTDSDGFTDTVYVGDLGGNMWRFRLCPQSDPTCDKSKWSGSLLYQATDTERGAGLSPASYTHKQIFTSATYTIDTLGNWWIYFGTGQATDPTVKPVDTSDTKNRMYGIKEGNLSGAYTTYPTYKTNNLTNITDTSVVYNAATATTNGWYINFATNSLPNTDTTILGEKMVSAPAMLGGILVFSTYLPFQGIAGTGTNCGEAGTDYLYEIKYMTGQGAATAHDERVKYVGLGVGSDAIISMRPGDSPGQSSPIGDIYLTSSGGGGIATKTGEAGQITGTASMTNIIYWKDKRLK